MGLMSIGYVQPAPAPVCDPVADMHRAATQLAAYALADRIADATDIPHSLVWQALCTVPDNMLSLLDSPQGWTALAGFVAAELGVYPPDYLPALH